MKRLFELDAIRGLAALAVVIFHYFYRYNEIYGHPNLPVNWSYYGSFGVQLFFMVSGFVIFWTLKKIDHPLDFIISRFSRLYPTYWCAVILTFSIVLAFSLPGREISTQNAVMNMLMFQEYLHIPHVDGAYWTLAVELTFYFWIFIFYLRSSLDKVEFFFLFFLLLSVFQSLGFVSFSHIINKIFILEYISFFLSGICFYKILYEDSRKLMTICILLLSLLSTIVIFSFSSFLIFSAFYVIFYLALSGRLQFLSIKPFIFLGSISYSLYLIHQNLGYVIINKFYEYSLNPLLGIAIALCCTIGLASLSLKYIEKPSLTYIRHQYKTNKKVHSVINRFKSSKQ